MQALFRLLAVLVLVTGLFVSVSGMADTPDGISSFPDETGLWTIHAGSTADQDGLFFDNETGFYHIVNQSGRFFSGYRDLATRDNQSFIGCIGPDNHSLVMLSEDGCFIFGPFQGSEEVSLAVLNLNEGALMIEDLKRNPLLPQFSYDPPDLSGWWDAVSTESYGANGRYSMVLSDGSGLFISDQEEYLVRGTSSQPGSEGQNTSLYGGLVGDRLTLLGLSESDALIMGRFMEDDTGIIHTLALDGSFPSVTTTRYSKTGQYRLLDDAVPSLSGRWQVTDFGIIDSGGVSLSDQKPVSFIIDQHTGSLISGSILSVKDLVSEPVRGAISDDGRSLVMIGSDGALFLGYIRGEEMGVTIVRRDTPSVAWFSARRG